MDKYIVKQISIDDGKTWFEAHFISPENYPAPKVHPTGGYGDIIEFTRDISVSYTHLTLPTNSRV